MSGGVILKAGTTGQDVSRRKTSASAGISANSANSGNICRGRFTGLVDGEKRRLEPLTAQDVTVFFPTNGVDPT
jgi:hypothetical protein